jgi:dimethylamine monooxygenase subunit A
LCYFATIHDNSASFMEFLPYFPFDERYSFGMGTVPLQPTEPIVKITADYLSELAEKHTLLALNHGYYFKANADTELAQWEAVDKILRQLAQFYPTHFELRIEGKNWHWHNRLTNEKQSFEFENAATLPFAPLDWVGRQVQEDLLLMANDAAVTLVAGQLCFPNDWDLNQKFGQPFLSIHDYIPKVLNPTMQAAQKFMERLVVHRPVWRLNWNFKIHNALDMSSQYFGASRRELAEIGPTLTDQTIGERLYLRVEHQTLTRLPRSNYILFGIHTYQNTVANEAQDPERARRMYQVLQTTPREVMEYKAIPVFESALLAFLQKHFQ